MQRFIRARGAFPVCMLVCVGVIAYVVSAATTYNDTNGRFTFTVPDGYVQRVRAGTDASFRSGSTQTSGFDVTVVAQAPDPVPDADTIAANTLKTLKAPTYTVGNTGVQPTVLGGQAARKFDYYTTLEGVTTRTHTLEVIAVTTKAAYVLVFSATEGDYDTMLTDTAIALGSFTFSGPGASGSVTTGGSATSATVAPAGAPDLAVSPASTTFTTTLPSVNTPTTVPSVATPAANLSAPPPITTPIVPTGPAFTISTPTAVLAPITGVNTATSTSVSGSAAPAFTISTPTAVLAPATGATAAAATAQATSTGRIGGIPTFAPPGPNDNARDRH